MAMESTCFGTLWLYYSIILLFYYKINGREELLLTAERELHTVGA